MPKNEENLHSEKQRWLCMSCGRRFTQDDGFLHLWYDGETVSRAIDLYWTGLSRTASSFLEGTRQGRQARAPSNAGFTDSPAWCRFISKLRPSFPEGGTPDEMFTSLEGKPALVWEVMDERARF
jgi:hypothetical protein